jgi:hypothetical protein
VNPKFFLFCFLFSQKESEVWFLEKRRKNWTNPLKALLGLGFSCPVFFREIGHTGHVGRKPLLGLGFRFSKKLDTFGQNWTLLDKTGHMDLKVQFLV